MNAKQEKILSQSKNISPRYLLWNQSLQEYMEFSILEPIISSRWEWMLLKLTFKLCNDKINPTKPCEGCKIFNNDATVKKDWPGADF